VVHTSDTQARVQGLADVAKQTSSETRAAGERSAEAASQAGSAATGVAQQAARDGKETFARGMRAVAETAAPLADASFHEERRLIETSARVTDLFKEATSETAEDVQALTATYAQLGQGMLRMQHAYFNTVLHAMARARRQPKDLLRCRSVTEVAEVQRDMYMDGVAFMMESSTTLIRLAGEVVQGAARPLEGRAREHAAG
jgi:hypothetical protein